MSTTTWGPSPGRWPPPFVPVISASPWGQAPSKAWANGSSPSFGKRRRAKPRTGRGTERQGRGSMRKGLRFVLVTALLGSAALAATQAPDALASVAYFQVDQVRLEGAFYLRHDEAVAAAFLPEGLSIWGDLEGIAERLGSHALVAEARVRRRLPSTLVLQVRERQPVALLPTPALVPVDAEGRILPIDPVHHDLDLPLLRPILEDGGALGPDELRMLAGEVARVAALEPRLAASVSEAALDGWGDVVIHILEPRTTLRFRPPLTRGRLEEGFEVLADALERTPGRIPVAIDLRFAEQVVVRYTSPNPR
ncbi:MAG: FtsQ-type POTRA domain-containing protein [Gemmatimonadales bacterium]|nr:MAG: FtsQ-type POTRA domain-containing protein [Gemmatimonadales bacterium]